MWKLELLGLGLELEVLITMPLGCQFKHFYILLAAVMVVFLVYKALVMKMSILIEKVSIDDE